MTIPLLFASLYDGQEVFLWILVGNTVSVSDDFTHRLQLYHNKFNKTRLKQLQQNHFAELTLVTVTSVGVGNESRLSD